MIFSPLVSLWIIAPLGIALIGWTLWQAWGHRHHQARRSVWLRRLVLALLLTLLLLRPSLSGGTAASGFANANIFFVVDTTGSMNAEDYNGAQVRLEGVKADMNALVSKLAGAHFSVLTFGRETYLELPLTTDASAVTSVANTLAPEVTIYGQGSSISQPVEKLTQQVKQAASRNPDRKTIIYYFGDGEQTASSSPSSFAGLSSYVSGGGVLGYGTSAGGKMKEYLGYGESGTYYITDWTAKPSRDALSQINESNLQAIASQMGVSYTHQIKPGDVDSIVAKIDLAKLTSESKDINSRQDLYWVIATPIVGILAWELWTMRDLMANTKKSKRSKS